jgi:hypothetical protein
MRMSEYAPVLQWRVGSALLTDLIILRRARAQSKRCAYPVCIAGNRNCPPEDCGGVCGYQELLAILTNPAHPKYADRIDWICDEFDPDRERRRRTATDHAA